MDNVVVINHDTSVDQVIEIINEHLQPYHLRFKWHEATQEKQANNGKVHYELVSLT